eukprot:403349448
MSDSNLQGEIKFISIARVSDATVLLQIKQQQIKNVYADEFKKEAQNIANSLRDSTAYPDLREMSESMYGNFYTTCDKNMIAYSVLTDSDFRSNNAYQLLKECINEVYSQYSDVDVDSVSNLNRCRDSISNLINGNLQGSGISEIKKNDKLSKAQDVVSQATKAMQDNVRNMISNQKDVTDLEDKSNNIKNTAFDFKNNAKALEREARKRNCRLWAIIICLVVSALIYIIVPLATTS